MAEAKKNMEGHFTKGKGDEEDIIKVCVVCVKNPRNSIGLL